MKRRHLDDILVRHKTEEGYESVCLTDLPWEDAHRAIFKMAMTARNPTDAYFRVMKHFHERLRAIADQNDITGEP